MKYSPNHNKMFNSSNNTACVSSLTNVSNMSPFLSHTYSTTSLTLPDCSIITNDNMGEHIQMLSESN